MIHYARVLGRRYLPERTIEAMRKPFRFIRSRKRATARKEIRPFYLEDLTRSLKSAGIESGDILMVHSSLSRIGNVDGGAETVIRSFLDAVTVEGTIIMPCYNSAEAVLKEMRIGKYIDLRTSPSATGKITEAFRKWPNVFRSSHPFSSACALGKQAEYVTSGHAQGPSVCHTESPVGRLVKLQGKVIGIGIPIAQGLGVAHFLEDTWSEFPFEVHVPPRSIKYIDSIGHEVLRDIIRFDPIVSRTRIDHPEGSWICEKLTAHLEKNGILKAFHYGQADSWLMDSVELFDELKRLAAKGVTMYLTKDKLTIENSDVDNW